MQNLVNSYIATPAYPGEKGAQPSKVDPFVTANNVVDPSSAHLSAVTELMRHALPLTDISNNEFEVLCHAQRETTVQTVRRAR